MAIGASKLPVVCLSQPTVEGPTMPPTAPMALMSAMAPASAVPERNFPGIAQNGPRVQSSPPAATARAAIAHAGDAK